jgi:hypothetical protein
MYACMLGDVSAGRIGAYQFRSPDRLARVASLFQTKNCESGVRHVYVAAMQAHGIRSVLQRPCWRT